MVAAQLLTAPGNHRWFRPSHQYAFGAAAGNEQTFTLPLRLGVHPRHDGPVAAVTIHNQDRRLHVHHA
jgi:hypothetical protein